MRCTVTQLAHESVGLCSLSWFVREGIRELVNRIIKITHAHNLHMKMLDFAPERTHIVNGHLHFKAFECCNMYYKMKPGE